MLNDLALEQLSRPDERAIAARRLVSIEAAPAANDRSTLPLNDVLSSLRTQFPAAAPTEPDTAEAALPPTDALRAYARGRTRLLSGDAAGAVTDLEAATRLDPNSAAPWRTLGEAQWNAGRRSSAITSFRRAVELGLDEPRPLWLSGRELARTGRAAEGLLLLAQARDVAASDPWLIPTIEADLAQVLWSEGYRAAGMAMLPAALRSLDTIDPSDRRRPEVSEIQRRRGDLWQRAGDWAMAGGDLRAAADFYREASRAPIADPGALSLRQIDVLLRRGQSALAARMIVDRVQAASGRLDPADPTLIAHIAESTNAGPAMGEALAAVRAEAAAAGASTRVLSGLTLTLASSLSPDRAQSLLLEALAGRPLDDGLFASLLDASERAGAAQDSAATVDLIERAIAGNPENARRAAAVLTLRGQSLPGLVNRLGSSEDHGGIACAVHLSQELGLHDRAREIASRGSDPDATLLIARAWASAGAARFSEANAALEQLAALPESTQSLAITRERALILSELGRTTEAVQLLTAAAGATPDAPTAMTLADLHLGSLPSDVVREAERLLRIVRAADSGEEEAASVLFGLYSPRGPLADSAKLGAIIRDLRSTNAAAWLLRVEQSRELAGRSLWPQAAALLEDLSRQNPEPPGVITTLASIWERAADTQPELSAKGEASLRAKLERRPDAPLVNIALARLLAATDRAAEGEALLAAAQSRWPLPEWGAARESLVADALGEPERSIELARVRLEAAPPTAANTLELAEVLLRSSNPEAAARVLGERLPPDAPLTPAQLSRLTRMVTGIRVETLANDAGSASAVLRLFDLIMARGVTLPPDLGLARARLIAMSRPDDTSAIVAAIDALGESLAATNTPAGTAPDPRRLNDARLAATVAIATTLASLPDATPLLSLLAEVSQRGESSPELLYEWYRLTFVRGDLDDCLRLVNGVREPAQLLAAIAERTGGEIDVPDDPAHERATIGYALASSAHALSRYDIAEPLYRHTLTLLPGHPWTCNNLGYMLLEQERDLAEAERLITIAYETLNEEASVIDSLAWVRYKRGHVLDYTNENGNDVEGALTLLERAMQFGGVGDDTIVDHLGDALWRADRTIEARRAWSEARLYLQSQLDSIERDAALQRADNRAPRGPAPAADVESPMILKLRRELSNVTRKLDALDQGLQPPIALFAPGVPDPLRVPPANP
jgi:tetratricopeptide (TPR) repeat protein